MLILNTNASPEIISNMLKRNIQGPEHILNLKSLFFCYDCEFQTAFLTPCRKVGVSITAHNPK